MGMSRLLRYGLLAALALGGVLLFLLAAASGNTQTFTRHYPLLLIINGAIAAVLAVLVIASIVRLVRRWRQGRFGARLTARFAVAFALIGLAPGVLIYVVSVQFLSRSIESWFDVRVDRALESGLTLARAALDAQLADLTGKAQIMALELAEVPAAGQLAALDRARERAGVQEAALISAGGQLLGASGYPTGILVPELPTVTELRRARSQRVLQLTEGDAQANDAGGGLRTRVIVPIPAPLPLQLGPTRGGSGLSLRAVTADPLFLQVVQRVPTSVASNAESLQSGYRDYQELSLGRGGLLRIYTVTLTLTLLLAAFAAAAAGFLLAGNLAAPLLRVAEGTRAVAEGDFRALPEPRVNDEMRTLTQSFNAMTRQLSEARDAVETKQRELENARAFLERVLANLSAGVLVLDDEYRLVTANFGASRILGLPLAARTRAPLAELAPELAAAVTEAFAEQALTAPAESWQRQLSLPRPGAEAGAPPLALLARGSPLPLDEGAGHVVVFDDVTQVISAQRAVAWAEVARRLAHEIKNPLTPIQLAAERLQMKLGPGLPPEQAQVLSRGAATIVAQVAAMKRMVDDFRDYARVPPARLAPLDLNALIEEVAALYGVEHEGQARRGTTAAGVALELHLAAALPPIEGDATQLRQVIHNLLVNAQDAAGGRGTAAQIGLSTEAVHGADGAARAVRLTVEDNGSGFPPHILARAFEPYVTTKAGGTGLGLAMVKKIVDEHGARVELANRGLAAGGGARVTVLFRRLAAPAATAA
jgi:nitrogen fixation/metabolism regulation signal transduction histidine kinase